MTQEQRTATLTTVFSEVLADLAFMFSDDDPDAVSAGNDTWLETEISYGGSQCGTLRFWCTREFSARLAANLLGTDPDEDIIETAANDAVKEFMNIVCGQFITATHGTEKIFDLTIPSLRELSEAPQLPDQPNLSSTTLFVEGQQVLLTYEPAVESAVSE